MNHYQEFVTDEQNRNKKVLKLEDLTEVIEVKSKYFTRKELFDKLIDSDLFSLNQIENIMSAIGTYSIGCCVVAFILIGIRLTGDDIDTLYEN